jgi:peptidoglycan/LPS O-acetylase OafA/YrhL
MLGSFTQEKAGNGSTAGFNSSSSRQEHCWRLCCAIGGWALVLLGTILFLFSVLGIPEFYVPRWLAYLGRISYGLYIFHALLFHLCFDAGEHWLPRRWLALHLPPSVLPLVGTMLVLALTIAFAALSYRYFERPFLKLKERFTLVPSRPE